MKRGINYPALVLTALIVGTLVVLTAHEIPALPLIRGLFGYRGPLLTQAAELATCPSSPQPGAPYVFSGDCKGEARSPDGRFVIVKNGRICDWVGMVRGSDGASLDDLGLLDDGKGFTIGWAPGGGWFFANHAFDGVDQVQVYRMDADHMTRWDSLAGAAQQAAAAHAGCSAHATIGLTARRWSRDGQHMVLLARPDAAHCRDSAALWMIGDAASGTVDPASLRSGDPKTMPKDGAYAAR